MYTFGVLDSAHNELIHDVCYDYYGKRLAVEQSTLFQYGSPRYLIYNILDRVI